MNPNTQNQKSKPHRQAIINVTHPMTMTKRTTQGLCAAALPLLAAFAPAVNSPAAAGRRKSNFLTIMAIALLALLSTSLHAQKITVLHNFDCSPTDGKVPAARLLLSGNTLYGTTSIGGSNNNGTVFSVNTDGTGYRTLYAFGPGNGYYSWYFNGTNYYHNWDGQNPRAGLTISGDTLYGTTSGGGLPEGGGDVFSINTNGVGFTVILNFYGPGGGVSPTSDLLLSGDTLYGTCSGGYGGSVFSVQTNGTAYSNVHWFARNDGNSPPGNWEGFDDPSAGILMSGDTIYGLTKDSGYHDDMIARIFSVNVKTSALTTNFTFTKVNGTFPQGTWPKGPLILSGDTLYGKMSLGGSNNNGVIFSINTNGSAFTMLHSFSASGGYVPNADGVGPLGALILAGDTLYGVADGGGLHEGGTIFSIKTNGTGFTTLYNFGGGSAGVSPYGGLVLSGCLLYGTTSGSSCSGGGVDSAGTVFSFAIAPGIADFSMAGTSLTLHATNGVANCSYTALASTNPALPLNQWMPLATNTLTQAGDFYFNIPRAIDPAASQQFFALRAQ